MLSSLHIRNYALIDTLDVSFPDALIIISGPTGAGKSILLGALGLLSGAKADAAAIADGAQTCIVEGEFDVKDEGLRRLCLENDLDYDEGHLIIRRTVSESGRSRGFINDSPVPLSLLAEFGSALVDIHSQHDTLLLTDKAYQLSVLDAVAGNGELLAKCGSNCTALREVRLRISALEERIARIRQESDYNAAVYEQLLSAGLQEGQIAELEAEQYQLAHSEQIKELLSAADDLLDATDASDGRQGITSDLSALGRNMDKLVEFIPSFRDLAARVESARIELKDIAEEVEAANERAVSDPARLESIDARLSLLYGLLKRHNCSTEAELIAKRDALQQEVCGSEQLQDELEQLRGQCAALEKEQKEICDGLHAAREKAVPSFVKRILHTLSFMELDRAVFDVRLNPVQPGPSGADQAEFLFSGGGSKPAPVAKCASGGELSRIMLALKELMSRHMNMPTMIFDEIDTGISGSVADHMGSVICEMGTRMQVVAITHLPQVAAKGSAHYLVQKSVEGDRAVSSIKKLSRDERVLELARMLSGAKVTDEALANAKALLD